jgi:hypothetical protein
VKSGDREEREDQVRKHYAAIVTTNRQMRPKAVRSAISMIKSPAERCDPERERIIGRRDKCALNRFTRTLHKEFAPAIFSHIRGVTQALRQGTDKCQGTQCERVQAALMHAAGLCRRRNMNQSGQGARMTCARSRLDRSKLLVQFCDRAVNHAARETVDC